MPTLIETLSLGELQTNCYLLSAGGNCVIVVDPAESGPVLEFCRKSQLDVSHIILTHGHFDHILGADEIASETGAPVACGAKEAAMLPDPESNMSLYYGKSCSLKPQILLAGEEHFEGFRIIETPGHTAGSISLAWNDHVICGDVLFSGSIGRTDLPGGDTGTLISSIRRLFQLPDSTVVLPGHGPSTTIGREKRHNPFLVGL